MDKPILVLGATGAFGNAITRQLVRAGRAVRCLVRNPEKARKLPREVDLVEGDVLAPELAARSAEGCSAIVHAVNFPYQDWTIYMERVTRIVIAAAAASGAVILFPGNVYGLGRQAGAPLNEEVPNRPTTRKGTLRMNLELLLSDAAESGQARTILLRAGDFFGPTVRNGLVDSIFGHAARGKPIHALGNLQADHQWAYVPDLARAAVEILEMSDRLQPFAVFHFEGYIARPQSEFLRLVAAGSGNPDLPIRRFAWPMLRIVGFFDPSVRELMELRYLFDEAILLDGARLRLLLPDFTATPIDEAVRTTIESYR